jgi:hypothetical protein
MWKPYTLAGGLWRMLADMTEWIMEIASVNICQRVVAELSVLQ